MGQFERETILGLAGKDTKNELENRMEDGRIRRWGRERVSHWKSTGNTTEENLRELYGNNEIKSCKKKGRTWEVGKWIQPELQLKGEINWDSDREVQNKLGKQ